MTRFSGRHILKIISLLLACFLWFYVFNSEKVTIEFEVPIVFIPPRGQAVSNIIPRSVLVKVEGARGFVRNFRPLKSKIYLKAKDFSKGKKNFIVKVGKKMIPMPFGLKIVELSPVNFKVVLDQEIKKWVPIRVQLIGNTPGNRLIRPEPEKVMIKGPRSVLKKIGLLKTIPIEGDSIAKEVPLENSDPRVSFEKFSGEVKLIDDN